MLHGVEHAIWWYDVLHNFDSIVIILCKTLLIMCYRLLFLKNLLQNIQHLKLLKLMSICAQLHRHNMEFLQCQWCNYSFMGKKSLNLSVFRKKNSIYCWKNMINFNKKYINICCIKSYNFTQLFDNLIIFFFLLIFCKMFKNR